MDVQKGRRMLTAMMMAMLIIPGCGWTSTNFSPEQVYRNALAGIAGRESVKFQGQAGLRRNEENGYKDQFHYEGSLKDHDELTLHTVLPVSGKEPGIQSMSASGNSVTFARLGSRWISLSGESDTMHGTLARFNPISQLEGLSTVPKRMTTEHSAARGTRMIRIELGPTEAHQWIAAQLSDEMSSIRRQYDQKASSQAGPEGNRVQQEMDQVWDKGQQELVQMLNGAEASVVYHLTVDRSSSLPIRLSSESRLQYNDKNGRPQQESLVTDVNFEDYK
ncbi:hypothetical protein Q5741_02465 [Paenibacillus sp. JX-17]|uniref:Lipoprotein n=1 Tax=Paenibacillus lacisoli TaxID=3064525 RepID=A0ABT9CC63_9BACL|nr:hypothetical protein [Paenibacillus sp. JX-17]MDO7905276.1 hypothetical protein [Paenibacillus sp. JX-17]